jgi:serine/threonine protein kinase
MILIIIDYFADLHAKNFFHGDIKPDNILINYMNFGIISDSGSLLYLGDD